LRPWDWIYSCYILATCSIDHGTGVLGLFNAGVTIDTRRVLKKKRASKQTQCVTPIQSPAITSYKKMHQLEIYRRPREFSPPANKDYQSPWTIARKLLIPFCRVPFGRFPSISMTRVASQVACTGDPPMRLCSKPLVLAQSPEQTQVNASKMLHASAVNSNLKYTVWWV
jgi:hypothetical protein